jgi:hypothetical protein
MLPKQVVVSILVLLSAGAASGQQANESSARLPGSPALVDSTSACSQPESLLTVNGPTMAARLTIPAGQRATDGTYTGTTSQGRAIQVVITGGQVTQFTISYGCTGYSPSWVSNQTCPISSNSFNCHGGGSVGVCTYGVFEYDLSGTVDSSTALSGSFVIRDADGMPTYPCCSLNLTWSASLPAPPDAPTNLTGTAYPPGKVDLAWTDNASDETEYRVERKLESEVSFTQIATLAADATSHTDDNVEKGLSYVYRVLACNAQGCSDPSNEVTVQVPALFYFIGD